MAGCLAVGWFSIARFEGDPYPYLVRWLWPIVVLSLVAAAWAYVRALGRVLATRSASPATADARPAVRPGLGRSRCGVRWPGSVSPSSR